MLQFKLTKLALVFAFMLATLACAPLAALSYPHSKDTHFYLGGGFNPMKLREAYATCIHYSSKYNLDGAGAANTSVVIKSIKNRKELFSTLGASLEVSAQSFFGGAELSADYLEQSEFFDDSITWVVLGKSDFGRTALKDPQLLPKFQQLIDNNQHADFAATCGTHYFAQETRSASVFAIYTLRNLQRSQKTRIETLLQARASMGPLFSVNLDSEFKSLLTQAARSSQMSCHAYAVGGNGIRDLSGLVTAYATDINNVQQIIANYMGTIRADNAAPSAYQSVSMREFGYREPSALDFEKRDAALTQYYLLMREGQDIASRLFALIFKGGNNDLKVSATQIADYKRLYETLIANLEKIQSSASQCHDNALACVYPKMTLPYVSWPSTPDEQCVDYSALPSRIVEKDRPTDLPPQLSPDHECEDARSGYLKSGCINLREYYELKAMRAEPICKAKRGITSIAFCA